MAGGGDGRSVAAKLFAIADAFEGGRELTLSQIAQRAKLPLSTAHRLLGEWVAWGGLDRTDDGRYRMGLRMWRLGVRQPTAHRLRSVALPYLEDLLEASREHVHLAVRDGLEATYLERLSGKDAIPVISDVGSRLPLHATGVGLVLLAYGPPELLDSVLEGGLTRYLPGTLTTERELRARLAETRATGIARSIQALTRGALSLGAPVRDASGEVIAAVSVVVRAEREREPQLPLVVRLAARGISGALGWRGEQGR